MPIKAVRFRRGWRRTLGSPLFEPPASNPDGNLGVIKGETCGFVNQLSHSRNRESRGLICLDCARISLSVA